MMSKQDAANQILEAKAAQGLSWEAIAEKIGRSPV